MKSVADIEGPWKDPEFESGLIVRCKGYWNVPVSDLPNAALATFLRQRIALEIVVPETRRRIQADFEDGSELYVGELAKALGDADIK